jgi:hypothetical protein
VFILGTQNKGVNSGNIRDPRNRDNSIMKKAVRLKKSTNSNLITSKYKKIVLEQSWSVAVT